MKVTMVGTGYVGLVSGVCFADFGHEVVCVDKDPGKIDTLNAGGVPIYEPGLEALIAKNVQAGRLSFTTDLAAAIDGSDAVFIAVGTPSRRGDGYADLSFVYAAAEEIAGLIPTGDEAFTVVVTKSTVPVGTGDEVERIMAEHAPRGAFEVVSNPEFLREGAAIDDFKRPDRVVVGTKNAQAEAVMRELYRPLFLNETPIVFTERRTSELIKYAANAFLATKITFINEVADLCEAVGANVQEVARGIGLDKRIGGKFLHAGPGYGGSCFPKDTLALARTAEEANVALSIVSAVIDANDARKRRMANKIVAALGGDVHGLRICILGLAFKPNTDDMRDAPSLTIIPRLIDKGAEIVAYDPEAMNEARSHMPDITYATDVYSAIDGADALVIITEWNEFRALDMKRVKQLLNAPNVIDLRNIYRGERLRDLGFSYTNVGYPAVSTA
ncbi:UDP-glucose dehydrogenase family protein [Algimonas porphyrae]|uniref:UDP-glucose 6-dehydrogenase n=1 Tax=Algimonas porphyrae TaxID=1128113 RepID=A0ABQ5V0M9_9PROT|nr:UDP-glucose/GDP-mannose dehydrogenase family protein [Algimonas porphyrae]GLQ19792.1 UDP-glucose 6-dehydrogenase [Algimonas porphyrae]